MRRYFETLRPADPLTATGSVPDSLLLVRVARAQYRWHRRNPYCEIRFAVLRPKEHTGSFITSRLECGPKAIWKLSWFLREFGYDSELLRRGEIDDQALVDLWGVIKVSHVMVRGASVPNLDAFSSADRWEELSATTDGDRAKSEVSS